ncbi:MAG: outer membrane beta-barrel protein [Ignavibacteria bacterium]|nr:outer membrane beta-barrel protein [Ignavibacteria bacterium]
MKTLLTVLLISVFALAPVIAQERTVERTVIVRQETDFFSLRVGTWFPKDKEKEFSTNNISTQQIDQSQAIGLDFTYRYPMGRPLYFDFAISGWYSTYNFKFREIINDPAVVQEADAWVVIVPVTVGISINPLPDNPLQPYAQIGIGGYFGTSGRSEYQVANTVKTTTKYDKTLIAFGGFVGLGLDFFITPSFALSLGGKYHIVTFDEEFLTRQKDFTGLQVLLGITTRI